MAQGYGQQPGIQRRDRMQFHTYWPYRGRSTDKTDNSPLAGRRCRLDLLLSQVEIKVIQRPALQPVGQIFAVLARDAHHPDGGRTLAVSVGQSFGGLGDGVEVAGGVHDRHMGAGWREIFRRLHDLAQSRESPAFPRPVNEPEGWLLQSQPLSGNRFARLHVFASPSVRSSLVVSTELSRSTHGSLPRGPASGLGSRLGAVPRA